MLTAETDSLESKIDRLTQEVAHGASLIGELVRRSDGDPLLDVLNRRAFLREGNRLCLMAQRHDFPISLLYVNVDRFRAINDRHGRRGGDNVLAHIAGKLGELLRGSDLIGRIGGDEFCGLLTHTEQPTADAKGRSLPQALLDEPVHYLDSDIEVRVSFSSVACHGRLIEDATDDAVRQIAEQRRVRNA
jgi:diguanylate cyclase (GGDEF)-like protein